MDSMYGPMSWLKLHGAGKTVIGLTSAPRTQTDFHLPKPCSVTGLANVLSAIVGQAADPLAEAAKAELKAERAPAEPDLTEAVSIPGPDAAPPPAVPPTPAAAPPAAPVVAAPSGATPAPAPQDQLPEEQPLAAEPEAPPPEPAPPAPARDPVFSDWLAPGKLAGRRRYQRGDGPALLIDADARQYHGPSSLKPLEGYFDGKVDEGEIAEVDDAAWSGEAAKLGDAQPLSRLAWYGGLLSGRGALMPGFPEDAQYRLTKWPQTEREFPRHFRIATAMMKGPATLGEIAEASGVPVSDVADFVNANLATGFAEQYVEPEPEPEPQQKGGLFGRLRGR
jgi:hypothetical protein